MQSIGSTSPPSPPDNQIQATLAAVERIRLARMHSPYECTSEEDRELILQAVGKLPIDVQEFVADCCAFYSVERDVDALCFSVSSEKHRILLLPPWREYIGHGNNDYAERIILHEIAHAWLRWRSETEPIFDIPLDGEAGESYANAQALSWLMEYEEEREAVKARTTRRRGQPESRRAAERQRAVLASLRRAHEQTTIKSDVPARVRGQIPKPEQ
jgi:hypothetical protein